MQKTQAKNSHACAPLNKVLFMYNLGKKIRKYIAFTGKSTTNPNDTPATTEKGNSKRKQTFSEKKSTINKWLALYNVIKKLNFTHLILVVYSLF